MFLHWLGFSMISNIFTGLKVGLGLTTNVILNQPSTTPLDNPIPIDAVTVVRQLRKLSLKVKGDFMDASGSIVNYNACKASTTFMEYKMLASKLSVISFNDLDTVHRKAFFINLYNSMIIHALIEGLLPDPGTISRLNMYATVSYNLGGYIFSLNDIENGLLRGNRRSAVPLSKPPFDGHDSRQSLMIECDPRIHFCLNCGAKSCPPISVYSEDPNVLDQQMTMATKGFLDGNTKVNLLEGCITLSMLFQWYRDDFGRNDNDIVQWVENYASEELSSSIQLMRTNHPKWKVKYGIYDWGVNDS